MASDAAQQSGDALYVSMLNTVLHPHRVLQHNLIWEDVMTVWHMQCSLCKKKNIHQVTAMLATSKNLLFPDHNHLLTTGTDDPSLRRSSKCRIISTGG